MNLLTYAQVKATLKVNDKTLQAWILSGDLAPIDQSGLYDGSEVGAAKLVLTIKGYYDQKKLAGVHSTPEVAEGAAAEQRG